MAELEAFWKNDQMIDKFIDEIDEFCDEFLNKKRKRSFYLVNKTMEFTDKEEDNKNTQKEKNDYIETNLNDKFGIDETMMNKSCNLNDDDKYDENENSDVVKIKENKILKVKNEIIKDNNIFTTESKKNTIATTLNSLFKTIDTSLQEENSHLIRDIIRSIKSFIIDILLIYANNLIIQYNIDDSGNEIKIELLLKIKGEIAQNSQVEFNIKLLSKNIKDILSEPITKNINGPDSDYNKRVIEKYYDCNIVQRIKNFFDIEFREIFIYFKNKNNPNLKGLEEIYEKQLVNRKKSSQKLIKENILYFIDIINNRTPHGNKNK